MTSKSKYIYNKKFREVVDYNEISDTMSHVKRITYYLNEVKPSLKIKVYKSVFKIPKTPNDKNKTHKRLYILKKNKEEVLTTNGHEFCRKVNSISKELCKNKFITSKLLQGLKVKSINSRIFYDIDSIRKSFIHNKFRKSYVLKPSEGSKGEDIYLNVSNFKDLVEASKKIFNKWAIVQIEPMINKEIDVRVQTLDGKYYGAVRRIKANVIGDGKLTIKELIKNKNKKKKYKPIVIDQETKNLLKIKELSENTILKSGEQVFLKEVSNFSQGGDVEDVSNKIHYKIANQVEKISEFLKLDNIGVDLLTSDITKPLEKTGGVILEVNSQPHWDVIYMVKGDCFLDDLIACIFKK